MVCNAAAGRAVFSPVTQIRRSARSTPGLGACSTIKCVYIPTTEVAPVKETDECTVRMTLAVGTRPATISPTPSGPAMISHEAVKELEAQLDNGASIAALRRFNNALQTLSVENWEPRVRAVMHELAYNLESFNPAFTAVLLKVQSTIGHSDYQQRDITLKHLIQPLAGEYGMHNNEPQARTHRELFSIFYADLLHAPLEAALAANPRPPASVVMFEAMMRDISTGGGRADIIDQACYALGYNLAIEYLADYEKTWMLDSFRGLDRNVLQPLGRGLTEWLFLEIHAEGEAEHAAIGHNAAVAFVPESKVEVMASAMADHDRDFAKFYNHLADLLEA